MVESPDAVLARASRGDEEAWRIIVEQYAPRVKALLRVRCGDADLAEELVQSTFCTVAEKLGTDSSGSYVEKGRFEAWLFRIAMNRLRDEMRRRNRQARPADLTGLDEHASVSAARPRTGAGLEDPGIETDSPIRAEELASMREALARLSDAEREVLELRHVGGLSFRQIADLRDEPLGTVLARQHRTLRKLRDLMGQHATDA